MTRLNDFRATLWVGTAILAATTAIAEPCGDRLSEIRPEVFEAKGETFHFQYRSPLTRRKRTLAGKWQIEREKRIGVQSERGGWGLAVDLLKFQIPHNPFHFEALDYKEWSGHMPRVASRMALGNGLTGADFIRGINNFFRPELDPILQKQLTDPVFNTQLEQATYFDTKEGELLKAGITLRTKLWFPDDTAEFRPDRASARMITCKIQLGIENGFHRRREYQVSVPTSMAAEDVRAVALALLQSVAPKIATVHPTHETILLNHRIGLKWMHQNTQIGFITADSFYDITDPERKNQQLELEVFDQPAVVKLLAENSQKLADFFDELQTHFQGVDLNHEPKIRSVRRSR